MNNALSAIRSALATKLGEVTELQDVQSGRTQVFSGYPACRHYLVGIENELKDNTPSNWRTYQFAVEIIQETSAKTIANAEADFQDTIDAVLDKLNSQWTLANNVDVSVVESGSIAAEEGNAGPRLTISILLAARTLIA